MMKAYSHILLAVDFSSGAMETGQRALDLAQRYHARLSLMHVVEPFPDIVDQPMLLDNVELERMAVNGARKKLNEHAESLGVGDAPLLVKQGSVKREVLAYAEEQGVDLIVVGSHGRHGLARMLGSTANAILHGSSCDVLAVRVKS